MKRLHRQEATKKYYSWTSKVARALSDSLKPNPSTSHNGKKKDKVGLEEEPAKNRTLSPRAFGKGGGREMRIKHRAKYLKKRKMSPLPSWVRMPSVAFSFFWEGTGEKGWICFILDRLLGNTSRPHQPRAPSRPGLLPPTPRLTW